MNRKGIRMMVIAALVLSACNEKKENIGKETKAVKVETSTVKMTSVGGMQSYSGTIEEASGTSLSFATIGTLKGIFVSEGQMVKAGQLIATVDETSVRNAYEAALAAKEQALDAETRMKQLHEAGSLPEIKWIEVQTQVKQALSSEKIAQKALADTKLFAPFSGYIARKQVEVGQSVAPGIPVVKLVKIDQVKVKISVPEEEIVKIQKGQTLHITAAALDNRQFSAKVTEKGVSADALSRAYEVKAVIENTGHELLPGMVCEVVTQHSGADAPQIILPAEIIQIDADNRPFVWTAANGKAKKVYVDLGENVGNGVLITNGLHEGDKVIVKGQQKVSTDMNVTE